MADRTSRDEVTSWEAGRRWTDEQAVTRIVGQAYQNTRKRSAEGKGKGQGSASRCTNGREEGGSGQ